MSKMPHFRFVLLRCFRQTVWCFLMLRRPLLLFWFRPGKQMKATSQPQVFTEQPSVNNDVISWFISEGSVFFSSLNAQESYTLRPFWGGSWVSHVLQEFCLDFRLSPLGSLKIVQEHGGLRPRCLCGWNCRNCMLKCGGLNVTGARSAH